MSRYYEMYVELENVNPERVEAVQDAANAEWPFDDWHAYDAPGDRGAVRSASGRGNLTGGESEQEFAERLAKVIWRANGGPCLISLDATYLGELPYDSYSFDESDYAKLMDKLSQGD